MKRLEGISDDQIKRVSFVAFLLANWVRAANDLFQEAVKVREAAEAAGEEVADSVVPEEADEDEAGAIEGDAGDDDADGDDDEAED